MRAKFSTHRQQNCRSPPCLRRLFINARTRELLTTRRLLRLRSRPRRATLPPPPPLGRLAARSPLPLVIVGGGGAGESARLRPGEPKSTFTPLATRRERARLLFSSLSGWSAAVAWRRQRRQAASGQRKRRRHLVRCEKNAPTLFALKSSSTVAFRVFEFEKPRKFCPRSLPFRKRS